MLGALELHAEPLDAFLRLSQRSGVFALVGICLAAGQLFCYGLNLSIQVFRVGNLRGFPLQLFISGVQVSQPVIQTVPVKPCGTFALQLVDPFLELCVPYLNLHEFLRLLLLLGGVQVDLALDIDHVLFHISHLFAQLLGVCLRR